MNISIFASLSLSVSKSVSIEPWPFSLSDYPCILYQLSGFGFLG